MGDAFFAQSIASVRLQRQLLAHNQQSSDNFCRIPTVHPGSDYQTTQFDLPVSIGTAIRFALLQFCAPALALLFAFDEQQLGLLLGQRPDHPLQLQFLLFNVSHSTLALASLIHATRNGAKRKGGPPHRGCERLASIAFALG